MAELAAGAVSSLLGVLKNEAQLLQRVGHDVVFIKEEMESMNSFLEHLARTAPPSGSHDKQVQTWMKQVRDLAHDCSNCIDYYLQRGDPAIYRAKRGIRGYFWWAAWLVEEYLAKRNAAVRLRELKERAGDVGKRRQRYDVQIRGKAAAPSPAAAGPEAGSSSSSFPLSQAAAAAQDDDEDEDDEDGAHGGASAAAATSSSSSYSSSYCRHQALEPPSLDNYFLEKISSWAAEATNQAGVSIMPCIGIVESGDASAIVSEGLTKARTQFRPDWTVRINLSRVHYSSDQLGPTRVLSYILKTCSAPKNNEQDVYREAHFYRFDAWLHNVKVEREISKKIEHNNAGKIKELEMKIDDMERQISERRGADNNTTRVTGGSGKTNQATEAAAGTNKTEETGRTNTSKETEATAGSNKTEEIGRADTSKETEEAAGTNQDGETKEADVDPVQTDKPLGVLYLALQTNKDEKAKASAKDVLGEADDTTIVMETAKKLKSHMEDGVNDPIRLHETHYQRILQEVFLTSKHKEAHEEVTTAATSRAAALGDDQVKEIMTQIKEIISIVKQDILEQIKDAKSHQTGQQKLDQIVCAIQDAKSNMSRLILKIKEQMVIKGIVDKIDEILNDQRTLIILEDENRRYGPKWEDIIEALKLLKCAKGSAVIVTTRNGDKAKEFCCPPTTEPITYSLVALYHDIVLKFTQQRVNNDEDGNRISHILRDILVKCHPHELCMKMFARALYMNPNRSSEELVRLRESLQVSENSMATNAKKIFKFSYKDIPREHKICLLYLAIFPPGEELRRSILIGRWLTEGLITKEDWPTAVRHAKQCFNALIDRMLVCPGAISDKGEYKSCMVSALVHGFITKNAKKQHILDPRLSNLLARHFSIFCGLRLRASDKICMFVKNLDSYSTQLSLLRLLDLQGCNCFDKKRYLEAICDSIPLLKYLSLRDTNVAHIPSEINKLHDLEILDIRQTRVPEYATKHILLLKLRRLLAGGTDPSPSSTCMGRTNKKQKLICPSVYIPEKIEKMENMEVLSNVMPSMHGNDNGLKNIGKLWQLRKLGVVIRDNDTHIKDLLQAIDDLKECLQSVSITIRPETKSRYSFTSEPTQLPNDLYNRLVNTPKHLESVSIQGYTNTSIRLLSLLGKGSNELAKVALSGTRVQDERFLKVIADLPKICCVRLGHDAYKAINLTFDKDEFQHLKCLFVEGHNMTEIDFKDGAPVELEKIVLSSTNLRSLCGVGYLPKLKELVLKRNELLFDSSSEDGGAPQQSNHAVSHTQDGAAPQKNTVLVSPSEDGAAPQKSAQLVSPSEDGGAPQKNNLAASTSESDADPQKNTILVSPSEVGAAPKPKIAEQPVSPSEDGAAPGNTNQHVSPTRDGEEAQKKTERKITFKEGEFQHLKYFTFEDSEMINIIFDDGAVPELEKIILSLKSKQSQLTVVGRLPKLKEIDLKGDKSILHSLFNGVKKIEKVTLYDTILNQGDLEFLAKQPYICCLELSENSYADSQLTFNKDDFPKLKLLSVNCSKIKNISFQDGCAPNLEKIVLSFVALESLSGIDKLQKLKELELKGDPVPPFLRQVKNDIRAHKKKIVVTSKNLQHPDEDKEHEKEEGEGSWFGGCVPIPMASCFSMKKDHQSSLADDQGN
ncbi:hypothetical protein BS78_05G198200 [Paspalum vaginatum]|nr:hypothetical protein BS78_05G198200 [Paspalum vaginatum]